MCGPATRRWSQARTVFFAVSGIDPELAGAAPGFFMGYEFTNDAPAGPEWHRGYPADTPHLEQAWQNFRRNIGAALRQAARLDPVPWRPALREVCQRTSGRPVDWWLTGSAALAVRGAAIEPGDLDLVCAGADAILLGDLFADELLEPVAWAGEGWISDWWGRAFRGARIEWIGGARPFADVPQPSDFGLAAARQLETLDFEGWPIRVPPLALQRSVSARRGLSGRVALIDALAASGG
jgi:hypothetical protein